MGRDKKYTEENIAGIGNKLLEWLKDETNIWLKDFAIQEKFPSEYFSRFSKENKEFNQALKKAKDIQESRLVKQGLSGKSIPFVIFALKNVAGWRDLPEQKQSENVKPIPYEIVEDNKNAEPDTNKPDTV